MFLRIFGHSSVDDGCTGMVIFVQTVGLKDDQDVEYHFVIKHSSVNPSYRKSWFLDSFYKGEIQLYSRVLPAFRRFLIRRHVDLQLTFSKFYNQLMLDDREIIVCVKGYELNHISKPLSLDELKILMEFYAKWHSISIAMKTLEPQIWKNTIYNLNYWKSFIVEAPAMQIFSKFHKCMCRMLKSRNEHEMLKKIEMLDFVQIARESIQEDNELTVVVHADCWNNNYLFKYKDGNVNDVAVVDWQLSSLGYIQNDLSCCILSCISSNEINEVDTLLEFYYYQFSTSLTKLGCNPQKVYSEDTFWNQWKKHVKYGLISLPYIFSKSVEKSESNKDPNNREFNDVFDVNDGHVEVDDRMLCVVRYLHERDLL